MKDLIGGSRRVGDSELDQTNQRHGQETEVTRCMSVQNFMLDSSKYVLISLQGLQVMKTRIYISDAVSYTHLTLPTKRIV